MNWIVRLVVLWGINILALIVVDWLFDSVGMDALRERSVRLTAFLESLLDEVATARPIRIITPREPARRGAQLSVRVPAAKELSRRLREDHGVIADEREPDIVRLAPVPLYSTYHDCWRAAVALRGSLGG